MARGWWRTPPRVASLAAMSPSGTRNGLRVSRAAGDDEGMEGHGLCLRGSLLPARFPCAAARSQPRSARRQRHRLARARNVHGVAIALEGVEIRDGGVRKRSHPRTASRLGAWFRFRSRLLLLLPASLQERCVREFGRTRGNVTGAAGVVPGRGEGEGGPSEGSVATESPPGARLTGLLTDLPLEPLHSFGRTVRLFTSPAHTRLSIFFFRNLLTLELFYPGRGTRRCAPV